MTKAFSQKIVKRFMNEEEYADFVQKYENARHSFPDRIVLTDIDRQLVAEFLAGKPIRELIKAYAKSEAYITKRVMVALQEGK